MNAVFVTGNAGKARYFAEILDLAVDHQPADTLEIQSLELAEIVEHKAKAAYNQIKRPVIVEDTRLAITSMGNLPGPFIKWFEQEIGLQNICRLADKDHNRAAIAGAAFAYYDGKALKTIESELSGLIPNEPRGKGGFGWNPIFIPSGQNKTLAEMDNETFKSFYIKIKPFGELRDFLLRIDKA